ncbi:hypothetical protein ACIBAI_16415 [Streptomyces sp. NPDC051041]
MTRAVELVEHAPAAGVALPDGIGRALAALRIVDAAPGGHRGRVPHRPG